MSNHPESLPTGDALAGVVIPAGCTCTTKANDMAAFTQSAICDAELEQIIEESDARWTEDMFHVHGGELMDMLRKAAALRSRQQVAEGAIPAGWVFYSADASIQSSDPRRPIGVMLKRDVGGVQWWLQLTEEEKERTQLYSSGAGMTLELAIQNAVSAILAAKEPHP